MQQIYFPLPLLQIFVEKKNGGARKLSIPAVRDRVIQTATLRVIGPILEAQFDDCSYAYREGHSVKQALDRVRKYRDAGYRWVVDADIEAFFDNVAHSLLLEKVACLLDDACVTGLIGQWITVDVWDGNSVHRLSRGIPQGSPISPALANLFLDQFDDEILRMGLKLIRYSDDFIILCKTPDNARFAKEITDKMMDALHLRLGEERVITFKDGFKFLGAIFLDDSIMIPFEGRKRDRRVLYVPPRLNLAAYLAERGHPQWPSSI